MADANLYAEGNIYYYDNRTNSKKDYTNPNLNHDFVVSRPVYILGSHSTPFDIYTISVCAITSSLNREGIPINIDGYRKGKILPYAIHSLHPEYLTRFMGHANDRVIQEVRNAVQYHLGFHDNVPEYITKYQEEIKERDAFLKSLSIRERTVYNFMLKHCIFKDTYYAIPSELVQSYFSIYTVNGYTRPSDFTKAFNKIRLKLFRTEVIETDLGEKKIAGMSLQKNIHRLEFTKKEGSPGIAASRNPEDNNSNEIDVSEMTREQLLAELATVQRREYKAMDIVQKFQNRRRNPDNFNFSTVNHHNARVIKRLIEMDVDVAIESIKRQLKGGKSPYDLSKFNMYILYHFDDKELEKCLAEKYRRKGLSKFRRSIKPQIKYLFRDD